MSDIVFILGAGASKEAGVPLMAEFLDRANDIYKDKTLLTQTQHDSFENVHRAISNLQALHSKADFDIHNIESIFGAMEMGKTINKFPGYSNEDEIAKLINDLKALIAVTIESSLQFPLNTHPIQSLPRIESPKPYDSFSHLIYQLMNEIRPQKTVSIITFNYDIASDFALIKRDIPIDYCFDSSPDKSKVPLLKLHGSLNWAYSPEKSYVVPYDVANLLNNFQPPEPKTNPNYNGIVLHPNYPAFVSLPLISTLSEWARSENLPEYPLLVPPSWNKENYYRKLSNVWRAAAQELQDAENIFVIGYSMPPSDSFFRYLYALGTVGGHPIRKFLVFNPDDSELMQSRFSNLLGLATRNRFEYHGMTFQEAIQHLRGMLLSK